VEEDSGESVKSEDREQFNSFQENCDEVVQMESENQELVIFSMYIALACVSGLGVECTKLCLKVFSRCSIADVKLPISLFISDISYY
jgi:hypothetical protein